MRRSVSYARPRKFGGLQVMVNNAGISGTMHRSFLDEDLADFHRIMTVNMLGVMAGAQHAERHMAANGGGSIINVSSIGCAGRRGSDDLPRLQGGRHPLL